MYIHFLFLEYYFSSILTRLILLNFMKDPDNLLDINKSRISETPHEYKYDSKFLGPVYHVIWLDLQMIPQFV